MPAYPVFIFPDNKFQTFKDFGKSTDQNKKITWEACEKYLGSSWIRYYFAIENESTSFFMLVSVNKQLTKLKEDYNIWRSKFCTLRFQL